MTALSELLARYPAQFRSELERALVAEVERLEREHRETLAGISPERTREVALQWAFEQAAKICEAHADDVGAFGQVTLCFELAKEIRARKGQP